MTALKAVVSDHSAQASPDTPLAAAQREFARVMRLRDRGEEASEEERELTDDELQARSDYFWPKGGEA